MPNPKNPNTHPENQIELLGKIIKEQGWRQAIKVSNQSGYIVSGHGRYQAALFIGAKEVPVDYQDYESEEQELADLLADNRIAELAEIDNKMLAELFGAIDIEHFDLDLTGYTKDEYSEISSAIDRALSDELIDPDEEVEAPKETYTVMGDIWRIGKHRLVCGDSSKEEDVRTLFEGEKAKCIFTSPPYNMGGNMYETYTDDLESKKYIEFNLNVVNLWKWNLNGYLFWNISYNKNARWEFIEIIYKIIKDTGLRFMELIVWDKGHGMPIVSKDMLTRQYEDILLVGDEEQISSDMELYYLGTTEKRGYFNKKKGKGITNYWRITTGNTQLDNHKACFPVELPRKAIDLTTNENDIVADCFGGSGTTLIACEQLNRKCYTMEYDPKYCDVIVKRYLKVTGKTDITLIRNGEEIPFEYIDFLKE